MSATCVPWYVPCVPVQTRPPRVAPLLPPEAEPTPCSDRRGGGGVAGGAWTAKTVKRPRQQPAHPQYANYWAPLTRTWHIPPHSAQPRHTNDWAPRTRKRHQREHQPQRPTERSDPTQHVKGRTGDRPGPHKGATTRRNVTQGEGGGVLVVSEGGGGYCAEAVPVRRVGRARAALFAFSSSVPSTPPAPSALRPRAQGLPPTAPSAPGPTSHGLRSGLASSVAGVRPPDPLCPSASGRSVRRCASPTGPCPAMCLWVCGGRPPLAASGLSRGALTPRRQGPMARTEARDEEG